VSGNVRDLNQAWDLYYHVFKRISRQLPQLISLGEKIISEIIQIIQKKLLSRDFNVEFYRASVRVTETFEVS